MPKTLVQAQTPDGGTISFAVDDATGVGPQRVTRENGAVIAKLDEPLDQAIASARPATETIINTFRTLSPDEINIEFGLNIDAQAGAVFAKAGIGAHFNITMKWTPASTEAPDGTAQST
jgi:NTP-dependent ternary system trypsin peptidase co-occuring protein